MSMTSFKKNCRLTPVKGRMKKAWRVAGTPEHGEYCERLRLQARSAKSCRATLYRNGVKKLIRNLGYLLRNWKEVVSISIDYSPEVLYYEDELVNRIKEPILLAVKFQNGSIYSIRWSSVTHCVNWFNRPVFKGLDILILSRAHKLGEYWSIELNNAINALPVEFR